MRRAAVVIGVVATSALAHADPVQFQLGLGMRHDLGDGSFEEPGWSDLPAASLSADLAITVPVGRTYAVGLRASVAKARTASFKDWGMVFYDEYFHSEAPLEVVALVERRFGRLAITPWVGIHTRRHTVAVGGCGPFLMNQPPPRCSGLPDYNLTDETYWTPINPLVGGAVSVDVARVSGAVVGVAAYAQYTPTLPSMGIDLVMRL